MKKTSFLLITLFVFVGCSESFDINVSFGNKESINPGIDDAFFSTYKPMNSQPILFKSANIYDGIGGELKNYDLLISDGKILEIGKSLSVDNVLIIDSTNKWITPGIIDIHSHMGVYSAPDVSTSSDGNEATSPVTAEVWAEHSLWTQDPQFALALKGGVTAFHVLPGSANLFGGRGATFKNVSQNTIQAMKFPGAPHSLKMACGENPKRVYGNRTQAPSTRMGNMAGYRSTWIDAVEYTDGMNEDNPDYRPTRNLAMDTLMGVLKGEILIQNHCYRAEEMAMMIEMSREFNYKITAFHHAVEAYKIADLLADEEICAALWADWWGFKHEAYDMVQANVAIVDQARNGSGCAIVHSDDPVGIQHLNQEAAKAMSAGNRAGFDISRAHAIRWITSNPAKAAGILDQTGSIEIGKDADIVLWTGNPFSIYSRAEKVLIDGAIAFDMTNPAIQPITDFDLGIIKPIENRVK
ncbi:MAG: amidohydrolase [Gammaproteobacteria bacterium]|nr:amidohydrolase [Gammaproteobacteria bacterium]